MNIDLIKSKVKSWLDKNKDYNVSEAVHEPKKFKESKSGFKFSKRSLDNLKGVDEDLVQVVHLALGLSSIDFVVIQGLRTAEEQKKAFESGASEVRVSKHQSGRAVDFAAINNGKITWDPKFYLPVIEAFREAGIKCGVSLVSGCAWKFPLEDSNSAVEANEKYLKKKKGKKKFLDYSHIQLNT